MTEEYLGDGLYASIEGNLLVLRAPRFETTPTATLRPIDHWVGLEPRVFAELCRFAVEHGYGWIMESALKQFDALEGQHDQGRT